MLSAELNSNSSELSTLVLIFNPPIVYSRYKALSVAEFPVMVILLPFGDEYPLSIFSDSSGLDALYPSDPAGNET